MLKEFNFSSHDETGLLVCAGGFEPRSIAFVDRLRKTRCSFEKALVLQYESQRNDNEPNYKHLFHKLKTIMKFQPKVVFVNSDKPIQSCSNIKTKIGELAIKIVNKSAYVDISGMTHLWAISAIHACVSLGFRTSVIYTEARWYYPPKREQHKILKAWRNHQYDLAVAYLQSAGLKAVHILPEFGGNFRPGRPVCLMIFVGYEPNRIEGLVDTYAPGALILFYGKSPHKELQWRAQLSKFLHAELFSKWYVRETDISTLTVEEMLTKLEDEFQILQDEYDLAIAPQCSKMQALASYLFWQRHPETQLLFTSPVRFNPVRYSQGARKTFIYDISS